MNQYVTGSMIKRLRCGMNLTQYQLAEKMNVSEKTVSKWETGRGYPDISLIEPLAKNLGVSIIELFAGENVLNTNRSFNMLHQNFYVCPICGNIIQSTGEAVISCCGIVLPPIEAEEDNDDHRLGIERVEDEYYVTVPHEMSKTHYISFIASVGNNGTEIIKMYPESSAEAYFKVGGVRYFLYYCNRHGMFKVPAPVYKK